MPKGIYSQAFMILLAGPVTLDQVQAALSNFKVLGRTESVSDADTELTGWQMGGPSVVVSFDPENNGKVVIDICPEPWPDEMGGTPPTDFMLFGAWAMGNFGPATFPGSLERALEQSWGWPDASQTVDEHTCFLRVRMSYVLGSNADDDATVLPEGYDHNAALEEMTYLDKMAQALLKLPGALCYFNPSGEILLPEDELSQRIADAGEHQVANLSAWANIRLFKINDEWSLMDTVGNDQLELPDMEIIIPPGLDPQDADGFLRNVTWYLLTNGMIIKDGHTVTGPDGKTWTVQSYQNSLGTPPRNVMFWVPSELDELPEGFPERQPDSEENNAPDGDEMP